MIDRLLARPKFEATCSLVRSTILELMSRGAFPRPVRLGAGHLAWRQSDIEAWIISREQTGQMAGN
jgi:prophage regulatory protein